MKIFIHRNGINYGPYDRENIEGFLEEGLASGGDLAWTLGQEGWIPLRELLGLTSEPAVEQDSEGEQSEEQDDPELAETVAKIKTLVDKEEEQFALDLVRSLNEPQLYSELLRDCSIGQDGEDQGMPLLPDWLFNEQEVCNRHAFFLLLIKHCPEKAEVDSSLRRENLTNLNLVGGCGSLTNLDGLRVLTNLTSLNLRFCTSLTNLDVLSGLTKLTNLNLCDCSSLTNLDGLSGLINLKELNLSDCDSLTDVDGLISMTKLKDLNLSIENIKLKILRKLATEKSYHTS